MTTGALLTALFGALAWGMPSAKSVANAVDGHWVRADTFALKSQRDSLRRLSDISEQRHYLDSIAKDLKICIRYPVTCR